MNNSQPEGPVPSGSDNAAPQGNAPKARGRFFSGKLYDFSGVNEAIRKSPARRMSSEELKYARRRDWIALTLGVPALIGFLYLIAYLFKRL